MPRLRVKGFTLLELLVVLVIGAMLVTMVTMSVASHPSRDLRFEAERLAALLALAREEAQIRGTAIRFNADQQGYRFTALLDREWQPIPNEPNLRARPWEQPTEVLILRKDGNLLVEFGRDTVDAPFRIQLVRMAGAGAAKATIVANGLGDFRIED